MSERVLNRKRKLFLLSVLLYATLPAMLVGLVAFAFALRDMDREMQARSAESFRLLSRNYSTRMDLSLADLARTVALTADMTPLDDLLRPGALDSTLGTVNRNALHLFEDLGVLDRNGRHLAYSGPHDLQDRDYANEPWFREVMTKGQVISDVFLGYRNSPHFAIAVRRETGGRTWVLRASVNAFQFSTLLDGERFGRTGEVFLLGPGGALQTRSATYGNMLQAVDPAVAQAVADSGQGVTSLTRQGEELLLAATPLKAKPGWALVVQQEAREARQAWADKLRTLGLAFALGLVAIGLGALWALRSLLRRLERLDAEKRTFDDQMIQSQKLAAIGQLSAGIAHEINNPLAIIGEEAGWIQDLLKREALSQLAEMSEIRDSLREIVVQAGRCKEITHKLLSFARKMDATIRDVDMNSLVDDVVGMRERDASLDNIQIVKDLEANLPIIHSEPSQLRQVLLNLVNNAIDAIPHGGTITVHTEKSGADDGGVAFSVADTGIGIPRENIEKIFDPFFTTKLPGKGTGLGLSICHGIIQKLGGTITVSSEPGKGTTFLIRLPAQAPGESK
jgi:two-component system NtrC family sensor kinase